MAKKRSSGKQALSQAGKGRQKSRLITEDDLLRELKWISPASPSDESLRRAEEAKREAVQTMFGAIPKSQTPSALTSHIPTGSNLIGIGFGLKQVGDKGFDEADAVRIYVKTKQPKSNLRASEIIPAQVNGIPTDVVEINLVEPHQAGSLQPCGGSIGSKRRNDGTLGCLVRRPGHPELYILSCNHVLADLNAGIPGDLIFAPGLREGGNPNMPIAVLTAYPRLVFGGAPNYIDVAIAQLKIPGSVAPEILGIGRVQQPAMFASKYQSVKKHGFCTGNTLGVVAGISEDLTVPFDADHVVHFSRQMAIQGVGGKLFSEGGDSGSLVLDAQTSRPVGMIIAGAGPFGVASHISAILTTALEVV
jgi:hypothetical protein